MYLKSSFVNKIFKKFQAKNVLEKLSRLLSTTLQSLYTFIFFHKVSQKHCALLCESDRRALFFMLDICL